MTSRRHAHEWETELPDHGHPMLVGTRQTDLAEYGGDR